MFSAGEAGIGNNRIDYAVGGDIGFDSGTGNWSNSGGSVMQGDSSQWSAIISTTAKQVGGSAAKANVSISRFFR